MPNVLQVAAALYSKQIIRNICSVTHFFLLLFIDFYWTVVEFMMLFKTGSLKKKPYKENVFIIWIY